MTLQIEGHVDDRDTIIAGLRSQLAEVREELRQERVKSKQAQEGVQELQETLTPLYRGLAKIFGEIADIGLSNEQASSSPQSNHSAVWEAWKSRLGKPCAKIIEALQLHRTMNQTQIAIATGISRGNVPTYIFRINKAGLINKNGREYSLKEL